MGPLTKKALRWRARQSEINAERKVAAASKERWIAVLLALVFALIAFITIAIDVSFK